MALSLLVAPLAQSNQSPLNGHNTVPTPMFLPGAWDRHLANSLLLSHPQVWEHPVSFVDEGIDSGTHMVQNRGLDVGVTRLQPTQSHLHPPQIDWGASQEPPRSYNNQATISVSIAVYPRSA